MSVFPHRSINAIPLGIVSMLLALVIFVHAQANDPILRIETGMHTSAVRSLDVDKAGRYAVTASDDKTVRVWELATGRLLRILRINIGNSVTERMYAAAISPDGNTIAVGGSTVATTDDVFLFDRESGVMKKRLIGSYSNVLDLEFSPDGTRLAAAFGQTGVFVWNTADWSVAGRDDDYGDQSYSVDFDKSGRLVTSSLDGNIRLYDASVRLIAKKPAPGGDEPFAVRFSPDATKIAVGYGDGPHIDVISADKLALLYSPDNKDASGGDLGCVAWSRDGKQLFAGGRYHDKPSTTAIRRWADAGRGPFDEVAVTTDTIYDIISLEGGGLGFAAGDPSWGVLDASLALTKPSQTGNNADFRSGRELFQTNSAGDAIQFNWENFGSTTASFDLTQRRLTTEPKEYPGFHPPRTEADGLAITNWMNNPQPMLNGQLIKLGSHESSISLAIAPDSKSFLLGTDDHLLLIDRKNQEIWRVSPPDIDWTVNISGDGKLAIAGFGDGTIRWYRMSDGKELLAFFPHKDRKRWVLWTPSGYYDAAPGGEELIGWHVNNGLDKAADFFAVGQFRDTYYRPDIVSKVLKALDEDLAIKEANAARGLKDPATAVEDLLPPVVDIISPADGEKVVVGEITVRYRLRSPTGDPVTGIMAMVDGRTIAIERGLTLNVGKNGVEREVKVKVPEGASLISMLAINRNAPSQAAVVKVRTGTDRGTPVNEVAPPPVRRKLYVLAIGVGKYAVGSGLPVLTYPAKDANDFATTFQKQKGLGYADVEVKVLPDATHDEMVDGLDWIAKATTEKDVAMIFLAGHGITDGGEFYYFMPSDASFEAPKRRGVTFAEIENTLVSLKGQKLLFVDTCRSGAVLGKRGIIDINGIANKLNRETSGVAVFTASMGNENAEEDGKWGNGAFTSALLEGLGGKASTDQTGEISFSMLDRFLTRRVRELTSQRQTPTATKPLTVPDFVVARMR